MECLTKTYVGDESCINIEYKALKGYVLLR